MGSAHSLAERIGAHIIALAVLLGSFGCATTSAEKPSPDSVIAGLEVGDELQITTTDGEFIDYLSVTTSKSLFSG